MPAGDTGSGFFRLVSARRHRLQQSKCRQPVQCELRRLSSVSNIDKGFDAAPLFGLGIGYTINNWLRVDVTGEYRGKANFHGLDVGAIPGGGFADDRYFGSKSEWTFLFNGYVDLGTWWNITPFIGAGVGVSRNTISNFGDSRSA